MSSAAAIARKRRTEPPKPSSNTNNIQYNPNIQDQTKPQNGLTLPQVIHVIDARLITLESFMKDTKTTQTTQKSVSFDTSSETPVLSNEIVDEFQSRFDMLATEIANLKDIVLKLQSYTMDINKTLLEERIHIMSDIAEPSSMMNDTSAFNSIHENINFSQDNSGIE
jgi:hypothetical protein